MHYLYYGDSIKEIKSVTDNTTYFTFVIEGLVINLPEESEISFGFRARLSKSKLQFKYITNNLARVDVNIIEVPLELIDDGL